MGCFRAPQCRLFADVILALRESIHPRTYISKKEFSMNMADEIHEMCLDRIRTAALANCQFLAGDLAAETDSRAIIALLDRRIRELIRDVLLTARSQSTT